MSLRLVPKVEEELIFDLSFGKAHPQVFSGVIFQGSYSILNELLYHINNVGSDVFVHNNSSNPLLRGTLDFIDIKGILEQKKIDKKDKERFSNIIGRKLEDAFFVSEGKWFFSDNSETSFLRRDVVAKKGNVSTLTDNFTYVFNNDIYRISILSIFNELRMSKSYNACVKLPTIMSKVSGDIIRIFSYMFDVTYIVKPELDSKIKDSYYIIAKGLNKDRLDTVINNTKVSNASRKDLNLSSILEYNFDETPFNSEIKNFNIEIILEVTESLKRLIPN